MGWVFCFDNYEGVEVPLNGDGTYRFVPPGDAACKSCYFSSSPVKHLYITSGHAIHTAWTLMNTRTPQFVGVATHRTVNYQPHRLSLIQRCIPAL